MALLKAYLEDLTDLEIVRRCHATTREIVGGSPHGNLVVKLSERVVVKFGWGIYREEAENQKAASELLDPDIVRVPKVYRYFSHLVEDLDATRPKQFLVMEYIKGVVTASPGTYKMQKLHMVLHHLSTFRGTCPGPLRGGVSRGLLWEENGELHFHSNRQMERWLNIRLPDVNTKLKLQSYPLTLCHLDITPRNILWLEEGQVCLLDWASAGYYPRLFEACILSIMDSSNGDFEFELRKGIEQLTEEEAVQQQLLMRSFYNGIRYSFVSVIFSFYNAVFKAETQENSIDKKAEDETK